MSVSTQTRIAESPLASARSDFEAKLGAWAKLDQALRANLAAVNSCDPAAKQYIDEARGAANARFGAWSFYLRTAISAADGLVDLSNVTAAYDVMQRDAEAERQFLQNETTRLARQSERLWSNAELAGAHGDLKRLIEINGRRSQANTERLKRIAAAKASVPRLAVARDPALIAKQIELARSENDLWQLNYDALWLQVQSDCVLNPPKPPAPESKRKTGGKAQ